MHAMKRREFRSDTMTSPTEAMREAMRNAKVGDDVCEEDPTINELQELAAQKTGKEAALFVPSGAFGNQCAIGVHAGPGNEVIVSESTHVIEHEAGAIGALWGLQTRTITPSRKPYLTVDDIRPRLRLSGDVHEPDTGLIVLENALADGSVMPLGEMRRVRELSDEYNIPIHLDGARLFNAAVALEVEAVEIAALVDSVMFCLSKGLGAPIGSVICGTKSFIARARKRRKMMGGGMRQVGVLGAPGIIALTSGIERLAEDHANAKLLAELLVDIPGMVLDVNKVQTNMVFCRVAKAGRTEEELVRFLNAHGFDSYPPTPWGLRFVMSYEVNEEDVRDFARAIANYMG